MSARDRCVRALERFAEVLQFDRGVLFVPMISGLGGQGSFQVVHTLGFEDAASDALRAAHWGTADLAPEDDLHVSEDLARRLLIETGLIIALPCSTRHGPWLLLGRTAPQVRARGTIIEADRALFLLLAEQLSAQIEDLEQAAEDALDHEEARRASARERQRLRTELDAALAQSGAERLVTIERLVATLGLSLVGPLSLLDANIRGLAHLDGCSPDDEAVAGLRADLDLGVRRLTDGVEQLRALGGLPGDELLAVSVEDVLDRAIDGAGAVIARDVQIHRDLESGLTARGNTPRLALLLASLLRNAVEGMPTRLAEDNHVTIRTSAEGEEVVIEVVDNGTGMSEDVLANAFLPFFTTRSDSGHAGLGLTVARRIAEEHGGSLTATDNAPGTRLTLRLASATSAPLAAVDAPIRLLFIDEDEAARRSWRRAFSGTYFSAAAVRPGTDALLLLGNNQRYDLLVIDVDAPGNAGLDLLADIRAAWPELGRRVVFVSAGLARPALRRQVEQAAVPVLTKPVRPEDLIRALLRTRAGSASRTL